MRATIATASRVQLGAAISIAAAAIGLPLLYNYNSRIAAEARRARHAASSEKLTARERLAVELIVNERRAEKGLKPWPYDDAAKH